MALLSCLVGLVAVGLLGILIVLVALPAVSGGLERARIQREVAEASWRIHQQATAAFSQMLEAARRDSEGS